MPRALNDMKANHRRYGHYGQADAVANDLLRQFAALEIIGPEEAESEKYIAAYVKVVPGLGRMRMHLTSSDLNQHNYNLPPVTETTADQRRFIEYMARHHPSIPIKKGGHYAKLQGWARANVQNDNHAAIEQHVQDALEVLIRTSPNGSGQ